MQVIHQLLLQSLSDSHKNVLKIELKKIKNKTNFDAF